MLFPNAPRESGTGKRMTGMNIITFPTPYLKANMYLIHENGHGILIDPYDDPVMNAGIENAVERVDYIILTHEHYDHISGTDALRQRFQSRVLCGGVCGERIRNATDNFSRYFNAYVSLQTGETVPEELLPEEEYVTVADEDFTEYRELFWQGHRLELRETPGHSPGSICILLDRTSLFSGDSLLPGGKAMVRFPHSSRRQYEEKTLPYLRSLPRDVTVYPGHYEPFILGEHPSILYLSFESVQEDNNHDKS